MNMSIEYQMLLWTVILGLVQLVIHVLAAIKVRGMLWALGPRDSAMPPLVGVGGRLDRAFRNLLETFPFFAAAVLVAGNQGVHTALTAWGAQLFFWARVAYIPVYALGLPGLRTGIWGLSVVGIVMIVWAMV
ncbi:MAG TPA: MAPEG family protein [Gammaproteobacteria bacterium]|nr:MAPEG family protein [Gammaproteobacteria bacterium]